MFPVIVLLLSVGAAVVALVNVTPGSAGIVWAGLAIWLAVVANYLQSYDQGVASHNREARRSSGGNMPGSGPSPM